MLLRILFFLSSVTAFVRFQRQYPTTRHAATADDAAFLASLQARIDAPEKLPLVVLDSLLPRQRLELRVRNQDFVQLLSNRYTAECPFFGVLGLARLSTGERVHLKHGCQVEIHGKPKLLDDGSVRVTLVGTRRFRLETVESSEHGWTQASVEYLEDDTEGLVLARAMRDAQLLGPQIEQWIALARTRERSPGQVSQLLRDLGEYPDPLDDPTDCAVWVGALINPVPALGVSLEIRPALLTADDAHERVQIVAKAIQQSIDYMHSGKPLLSRE